MLVGLVLSVGTRTDSTVRRVYRLFHTYNSRTLQRGPVSSSLVTFAKTLPIKPVEVFGYSLISLVDDLGARAKANMTSNTIVIPVLETFNVLLEGDALVRLVEDADGLKR